LTAHAEPALGSTWAATAHQDLPNEPRQSQEHRIRHLPVASHKGLEAWNAQCARALRCNGLRQKAAPVATWRAGLCLRAVPNLRADLQGGSFAPLTFSSSPFVISSLLQHNKDLCSECESSFSHRGSRTVSPLQLQWRMGSLLPQTKETQCPHPAPFALHVATLCGRKLRCHSKDAIKSLVEFSRGADTNANHVQHKLLAHGNYQRSLKLETGKPVISIN
jgi:hypothetical protein